MAMQRFVLPLLLVALLANCGKEKDEEDSATVYTFTANIDPILKESCSSNGGCHEVSGSAGTYVGDKAAFLAKATTVKERINLASTNASYMPAVGSGKSLSAANKKILEDYLAQSTRE